MTDQAVVTLAKANKAFREGHAIEALTLYNVLLQTFPEAERLLKFNLSLLHAQYPELTEQHRDKNPQAPCAANPSHLEPTSNRRTSPLSIVVVFHLFHEDVVDYCLARIANIRGPYHLLVTTPLEATSQAVKKVQAFKKDVEIIFGENSGRDIGPFLKAWPKIRTFDLCCKIHTKKGVSDYISPWRDLCFDGILGSPFQVAHIVAAFEENKLLSLAGPELLYGSYESLIGNNKKNIEHLARILDLPLNSHSNNGFFMGTMFWMRTRHFNVLDKFSSVDFGPETGDKDGKFEHSIERLLGSKLLTNTSILLTRVNDSKHPSSRELLPNGASTVTTFHKHFDLFTISHQQKKSIAGHIHTSAGSDRMLSGWIALKGENTPREAIVRIDDTLEIDVLANRHRHDLQKSGINEGRHSFSIQLPLDVMDGLSHNFELIDKITGKIVSACKQEKAKVSQLDVRRVYEEWDYDRESYFLQYLSQHIKQLEDNTAPLASIIMPTYNREGFISKAINSILMQTYSNFELIIIDDGSTDETGSLIASCYKDSRVKYKYIENAGVSHARNSGLSLAKGDYVFFLDSDNTWKKDFLTRMIAYMRATSIDVAYSGMRVTDDTGETKAYKGADFSWDECLHSNYVDLNTVGYRRNTINSSIRFDETLKRLVDWDFILKLAVRQPVSYAPFLGVDYYDGSTSRITNSVYTNSAELGNVISSIRSRYEGKKYGTDELQSTFEGLTKTPRKRTRLIRKNGRPRVSTIITTYNHERYIAQAIESVLIQRGNFEHEIIISDDGSTDSTSKIVEYYASKYPGTIVNLSSPSNVGISANMHRCFSFSSGDLVAICEGDDFWTDPQKLEKQVDFLFENPICSMVFSMISMWDIDKDKRSLLPRQENIASPHLDGGDFLREPTMNLIANFSSCMFDGRVLRSFPDFMYDTRLNEIAVAFYFDRYGKIGFLNTPMSVYRFHQKGVWSGSDKVSQLRSGLEARRTALRAAAEPYRAGIQKIIKDRFEVPLQNLGFYEQGQ